MKRIRQYLARISKTSAPQSEGQEHHHLQVAKSTTTLSTTHSDNRPSFDENGVGAVVVCEGLPDGKEDENIDIIFVHHAGGSRVKSWTKNDCFWPRDLLAQEFPHARIITWGYNLPPLGKVDQFSEGLSNSLSDSLVADMNKIKAGSERSIIFVAHGLGGIILKDALSAVAVSQIYGKSSDASSIYASTIGVVFLGTPHKGVGKKPLVDTIARTAQLELRQQDEAFAQIIRDHVHLLTSQRDEFVLMSRDISVVCVRELYPYTPMSLMVPKATASYDGLNVAVDDVAADHFDIARFGNRRDPGYFQIVGHISKLSRRTGLLEDSEERLVRTKEILEALSFDFRSKQDDADIQYAPQCAGILSAPDGDEKMSNFDNWLQTPGPVFWISGNPGSGKTTLMKHAFHSEMVRGRLQKWAGNCQLIVASMFLFEGGGHLQKSREGILRAILFQVLTARPELVSVCFPSHITGPWPPSSPFNTVVNLSQAFYQLFSRMGKTLRLALFIDALDEYRIADQDYGAGENASVSLDGSTEGSSALLGSTKWISDSHNEIATLITEMGNADFIKLCVSSRELPPFEDALEGAPRMRVHTRTEKMISDYCATRLDLVAPGLSAGQKPLCDEVSRKSRGDILWARLAIDLLMEGSLKKLRDTLESLPQQLGGSSGLYMRIIQNLPPVKQRETCRIFELLLRAIESPGLVSLAFAVEGYLAPVQQQQQQQQRQHQSALVSAQSQKNGAEIGELAVAQDKANPFTAEDLHNISEHMERRMMSCCSGLLETTKTKKVVFMHLTAKEFALRGGIWDKVLVAPPNKAEMDLSLMSANIRYLRCLGTLNRLMRRLLPLRFTGESWLIIANTLRYAHRLDNVPFDTTAYIALLDELDETCRTLTRGRDPSPAPSGAAQDRSSTRSAVPVHWASLEPMELGQSPRRTSFLALAMQANLFNFVLSKLMALDYETRRARAQELLEYAVCPEGDSRAEGVPSVSACVSLTGSYKDFHHDLPETRFVQLLFELGADASGQTPASRDLWQRTVQSGHRYFTSSGALNALSFNQTPAQASPQNRQRWVAAVLLLLEHGADPHCQVETMGGSQLGTDSGSLESRPAIEIIRRTLEGEKDFAGDVIMMEALAVRAPPSRKASRRSMIVVDQLAAPSWQEKRDFGQLGATLEPPSPC